MQTVLKRKSMESCKSEWNAWQNLFRKKGERIVRSVLTAQLRLEKVKNVWTESLQTIFGLLADLKGEKH